MTNYSKYNNGACYGTKYYTCAMSFGYAPRPLEERFWEKTEKRENDCWIWHGHLTKAGYGQLSVSKRQGGGTVYVHRYAYELLVGPIPYALVIDHLCGVRNCVNPEHLEAVTHAENVRRGVQKHFANKTRCKYGHELTGENLSLAGGRRVCRECARRRNREYEARQKAAA